MEEHKYNTRERTRKLKNVKYRLKIKLDTIVEPKKININKKGGYKLRKVSRINYGILNMMYYEKYRKYIQRSSRLI